MTEQCNLLSPHSSLRFGVITDFISQNGKNTPQETNHNGKKLSQYLLKIFKPGIRGHTRNSISVLSECINLQIQIKVILRLSVQAMM